MTVIAVLDCITPVISGPGDDALDWRAGNSRQQRPHPVHREALNPVGHELEAEHEYAEAADDRNENILEVIDRHAAPVVARTVLHRPSNQLRLRVTRFPTLLQAGRNV